MAFKTLLKNIPIDLHRVHHSTDAAASKEASLIFNPFEKFRILHFQFTFFLKIAIFRRILAKSIEKRNKTKREKKKREKEGENAI